MNTPQPDITISPVSYSPSSGPERRRGPSLWQVSLIVAALLAIAAAWFVFTSKSVQIAFSPPAQDVNISGGFVFELGGVYLLREGQYELSATTPLHELLEQPIAVGTERNQKIELRFTPLPGFLTVNSSPDNATISIDGVPVSGVNTELPAGQHELSVSHPRYISSSQIVEIEGKRIEQQLSVELAPNWADVSVTSVPTGAAILIDDKPTNENTPAMVQALAGEREIRVQAQGFKAHRQRIFAQAGQSMTLAAIELVQADAQLFVDSTPSGAGVTIDGQFSGTTPLQLELKSSVAHRVQVIRNGYESFTRTVRLERGATRRLSPTLVRQTGELKVQALPAHAELFIEGNSRGSANQSIRLPIKPYEIEIRLEGYAGFKQTITPRAGLASEVKVKLLTIEEARLAALKPTITSSDGQNLKLFEPFAFTMGGSRREPGRRANETMREVDMTRLFYLATKEVTNAQFRRFAAGHDSGTYEEASLNEDDQPVVNVSWHDAAAYCNWLSEHEELTPFYEIEFGKVKDVNHSATGYRLPSEAEWAWAARTAGDGPGHDQLRFPWGSNLPPPERHGNYADRAASNLVGRVVFGYNDNHGVSAPVGTFKADARGLFDMGGNVAEWSNDFYEIPDKAPVTDPTGPGLGDYHVIKGSSWMHGTITELRFSFRDYGIDGRQDVGFRIARYAE